MPRVRECVALAKENHLVIVGNGLIAKAFSAKFHSAHDALIFASGVSDSTSTDEAQFERERRLIEAALAAHTGRFVYFSSCAAGDPSGASVSAYIRHKQQMEAIVLSGDDSLVLRLPQVVGRTGNPHTLTNFLHTCITQGIAFTIWKNAERNLIDVDDVVAIANELIRRPDSRQRVFSIAAPVSLPMPTIVHIFERLLGRKGHYSVEERGAPLIIDSAESNATAEALGIKFGPEYTERILRKYYVS
jgi:nucleoside-diphosphate-sugar epimerase